MKLDLYNREANKVGTVDLPDKIFSVKWNQSLVHQAVVAQMANQRKPIAHTKDRSEVRGGGKKPWRQKGTGRARHGSRRSPLWVHGGITFGPRKDKDFSKKINKKMKRAALFSVLSKKAARGELRVLTDFALEEPKTKYVVQMLKRFFKTPKSVLLIPSTQNKNVFQGARNIAHVAVLNPGMLNVYDCLRHAHIVFERQAVDELAHHYQG